MRERDTNKDWNDLANANPYFAVLSDQKYLDKNLTPERLEEFYGGGEGFIQKLFDDHLCSLMGKDWVPTRSLEFGCGVGRLVIPLARRSKSAVGVDIATRMLDLARERAEKEGIANLELVTTLDEVSDGNIDFIFSRIVLQHIVPAVGMKIFSQMLRRLSAGGAASIHVTFAKDNRWMKHAVGHYKLYRSEQTTVKVLVEDDGPDHTQMSMYDYDLNAVFAELYLNKIGIHRLDFVNHGGCIGINVIGKKAA